MRPQSHAIAKSRRKTACSSITLSVSPTLLNKMPPATHRPTPLGVVVANTESDRFPAITACLEPLPDIEPEHSACKPDEQVRMTVAGLMRIDKKLWRMSAVSARTLEPAFIRLLLVIGVLMIPREWPEWVRMVVEEIIMSMNPRNGISHNKAYRENIYKRMTNQLAPNIPTVWACMCMRRSDTRITGHLRRWLTPRHMEFLLDFDRLEFNNDGTRVSDRLAGRNKRWYDVSRAEIGQAVETSRRMPTRHLPVYILGQDNESVSVTQIELTPLIAQAKFTDFLHSESNGGAILVSHTGAVIRPRVITDSAGSVVGPGVITNHPYFMNRSISSAPLSHPLSTGGPQAREDPGSTNYIGPLLIRTEETYANATGMPLEETRDTENQEGGDAIDMVEWYLAPLRQEVDAAKEAVMTLSDWMTRLNPVNDLEELMTVGRKMRKAKRILKRLRRDYRASRQGIMPI